MRGAILVLAVLAACSDDQASPDAGVIDAAVDSPPPDAIVCATDAPARSCVAPGDFADCGPGSGSVTVHATGAFAVVFHCADGRPSGRATVAADGTAQGMVGPNGMVTMAFGGRCGPYWRTIVGVQPGETLAAIDFQAPMPTSVGTATLTLPGAFNGASSYRVSVGCGQFVDVTNPNVPVSLPILSDCVDASGNIAAQALARDGAGNSVAFSVRSGVALGGGSANAAFGAWRTDFTSATLHVSNAPANANISELGMITGPAYFPLRAGASIPPAGLSLSLALPAANGDDWVAVLTVPYLAAGTQTLWAYQRRSAATSASLDIGSQWPRFVEKHVDVCNPSRPIFYWTLQGDLSNADALIINDSEWMFLMSPQAQPPFVAPLMPCDLPPVGTNDIPTMAVFGYDTIAGWADARTRGLPNVGTTLFYSRPVPPTSGIRDAYALVIDWP